MRKVFYSTKVEKIMEESDHRCATCTQMFSRQGVEQSSSSHGFRYLTRDDCMMSVRKGCKLCEFIYHVVCRAHDEKWKSSDRLIFWNFRNMYSSTIESNLQLPGIYGLRGSTESRPDECLITLYPYAQKNNPIGRFVMRRPLQRDVQSDRVLSSAKFLINQCMDQHHPHQRCQYSRDTVLPLRVLDVGPHDDPDSIVKLKVSETEIHAPYLALSYCWGKQPEPSNPAQPFQLNRDTLDTLVKGISTEHLQQSIQDAILVTRQLGFQYLWVDALCIIQDCMIDKAKEISKMSLVYMNAAVTVAAASSKSAADGFLSKRIRPYLPSLKFRIPTLDGKIGTIYLSAEAYSPDHPLDKRGWVLQEFMLSSRLLIFSDYELLWQCQEVELRGVTGTGLEYLQPLEDLPWSVFEEGDSHYGSLDNEKIYKWKTIIVQYTERCLTNQDDRLRAVQGITSELETLWGDISIYGLWKKWFIQLLAWYKPEDKRERARYLKRAPSWSWASLNGVIRYGSPLAFEDAKATLVTVSTVMLTCRILTDDMIDEMGLDSIVERPDLHDPRTDFQQEKLVSQEAEYLLLGNLREEDEDETGIGLLVIDVGKGVYRRIGLVTFGDMRIWNGVKPRDIILEPQL